MQLLREGREPVAIVATNDALLEIEGRDPAALASALGAAPAASWPPEYGGEAYREWMAALLAAHPQEPGYGGWYVIGGGELVGSAGFKGPPAAGEVEIGYSVVPERQRRGYGAGAVDLLVARAFRDPRVTAVMAETLPGLEASQAVLRRCGFTLSARRDDPEAGEVLVFRRKR